MSALTKIKDAGFSIELEGGNLSITPASKLTTQQRDYIKLHKPEIIKCLKAANDPENLKSIERWLSWISEDDQEIIDEVLTKCRADSESLEYFLMRATEVPPYFDPKPESKPEKHACQECQHWQRDQIGDGSGLGKCKIDQNSLPWPSQTSCTKFCEEKIPEADRKYPETQ
jgi:hypothetical protein